MIKTIETGKMNGRGQEEIAGFVLIIVLVAIIFLVLLGLFLRGNGGNGQKSVQIRQFLDSAMEVTSDCTTVGSAYYSVLDLIGKCATDKSATCKNNNRNVCTVLNQTMTSLLNSGWPVGPESPNKGYVFDAYVNKTGRLELEKVKEIVKGNCSAGMIGDGFYAHPYYVNLKICS